MKHRDDIALGDPIEVRFVKAPMRRTFVGDAENRFDASHGDPEIEWKPATVCSLTDQAIGAAFANGIRMEVARHSSTWRPA